MHRVRKQREFNELNARTDFLTEDNASLQQQLASREAEIARLQREISGLTGRPAADAAVASASAAVGGASPRGGYSGGGGSQGGASSGQALQRQRGGGSVSSAAGAEWPQPALTASGVGGGSDPGYIVGVGGQFLRLRPGYPLPPPPELEGAQGSHAETVEEAQGRAQQDGRGRPGFRGTRSGP